MIAVKRENRWPMALVVVCIVLATSALIYCVNWETAATFSVWSWLIGLPIGIIVGYGWNLLIFSLALRLLKSVNDSWRGFEKSDDERKWFFLFYLALLYIPIGESYAMMIWHGSYYHATLIPAMGQMWQIALIAVPMAMIWLSSFVLAYAELKWERKKAGVMAVFLSVCTLLWIQLLLPYAMGRVG